MQAFHHTRAKAPATTNDRNQNRNILFVRCVKIIS